MSERSSAQLRLHPLDFEVEVEFAMAKLQKPTPTRHYIECDIRVQRAHDTDTVHEERLLDAIKFR